MICYIYKSIRKPDYYLYTGKKDDFNCVPEELLKLLGNLEYVFEVQVDENTGLASSDPEVVLDNINNNGYYLQIPPKIY